MADFKVWMYAVSLPIADHPNWDRFAATLRELSITDLTFDTNRDVTVRGGSTGRPFVFKTQPFIKGVQSLIRPNLVNRYKYIESCSRVMRDAYGIDVSPSMRPVFSKTWFETSAKAMIPKIKELGWKYILWNIEGFNWAGLDVAEVEDALKDWIKPNWEACPVPICMVSPPHIQGHKGILPVARWALKERGDLNGFAMPMCYTKYELFKPTDDGGTRKVVNNPTKDTVPAGLVRKAFEHWRPLIATAAQFVPIMVLEGSEYPGWTNYNAMAANLSASAEVGSRGVCFYPWGGAYSTARVEPFTGRASVERRRAIVKFVEDGYRISYRAVSLAQTKRAFAAAARGDEIKTVEDFIKRGKPRVDWREAQRRYRFETTHRVGGLLYDFTTRRWV